MMVSIRLTIRNVNLSKKDKVSNLKARIRLTIRNVNNNIFTRWLLVFGVLD